MQMIDDILKELAETKPEYISEISECKRILQKIEKEFRFMEIHIPRDRWLAIGAHVLAFVRRMTNGERLPVIEAELFAEIHPDMVMLSHKVLAEEKSAWQADDTEAFLLAVHFEAIRAMQMGPI
ncbi:hypothetical protein QIH01_19095 [Brevibacillus brevis]|uniref:hypothetical protein n=1 Tax=Brevibacillus brevis TaxID=1393 RepID=UPI0007D89FD6|nr:hypothetical protein [Brevibacillus brevis]WGV57589.1 hypothetical protein QIH01_19095 [Brevibacillus brevis]